MLREGYTLVSLIVLFCLAACASGNGASSTTSAPAIAPETSAAKAAPVPDVAPLLKRIATQDGCSDSTTEMRLTGQDEAGKKVEIEFRVQRKYAAEKTSTLMVVTAPKEDTEKALLAIEASDKPTEALSYLAGLKKIAKFKSDSTRDLRGAKITLQELLGMELSKYDAAQAERVTEGSTSLLKSELKAKDNEELAFPKVVVYFHSDNQQPARFELFDKANKLIRRINVQEVKTIQNYQTLTKLEIEDVVAGRKAQLEVLKAKYDQKLPDSMFTEAHLTRTITEASRKLIQ